MDHNPGPVRFRDRFDRSALYVNVRHKSRTLLEMRWAILGTNSSGATVSIFHTLFHRFLIVCRNLTFDTRATIRIGDCASIPFATTDNAKKVFDARRYRGGRLCCH
jgi:hypothetical protein